MYAMMLTWRSKDTCRLSALVSSTLTHWVIPSIFSTDRSLYRVSQSCMYNILFNPHHCLCIPFLQWLLPEFSQLLKMVSGSNPTILFSSLWVFKQLAEYCTNCTMSSVELASSRVVNTMGVIHPPSSQSLDVHVWGCVWVCSLWCLTETFAIHQNYTPHTSILQMMFIKWSFLHSQPKIILFGRNKQEQ